MAEILLWIIFIGTFYVVFKFIWTHVTTVSHSGLQGFIHSWWEQFLWAFVIAGVVTAIAAHILESVMNFGRGFNFDFSDVLIGGVVLYVLYAIFASSDAFDRKTFRENYNRHVVKLNEKLNLHGNILSYIDHDSPGELIDLNDKREEYRRLALAEDFVSEGSSKLVQFPNMSISHHVNNKGNVTSITVYLKSKTGEFYSQSRNEADYAGKMGSILFMEKLIAEIAFTAAIEAVAEGKSRAIENSLHLIKKGEFSLLEYISDSDEKIRRDYSEDGIDYTVSMNSGEFISLKMLKLSSRDK